MQTEKFVAYLERSEDESWARYGRILDRARSLNISATQKEAERLHQTRSSRRLLLKPTISIDGLVKAHLEDMSYRSRLVEINVEVARMKRNLEMVLGAIGSYLRANHMTSLERYAGRTKTDQTHFIDALLGDGWSTVARFESLQEAVGQIIEDIDKSGWAYRNLVQLMQLAAQRESVIKQVEI